jgi:hypothetical protein
MNTIKVTGIFLMNAVMLAVAFGLLRLAVAVPHSESAFATVEFMLAVVCWGGSSWALYLFMQGSVDWELPAVVIAAGTVAFLLTNLYPAFAHDFVQPGAFFAAFAMFAAVLMLAFSAAWTVVRIRNRGKSQEEQVAS